MLCKLCHLERARSKKRKSEALTITATFSGQIRASENTRDSPETCARFSWPAERLKACFYRCGKGRCSHGVGGGGCHLHNEFRNQDRLRCETGCTGETCVLPTLLCEWPGVDKSGSWNPTSQCGLKCNTARMRNYSELEIHFFSWHSRIKWKMNEWKGSWRRM